VFHLPPVCKTANGGQSYIVTSYVLGVWETTLSQQ